MTRSNGDADELVILKMNCWPDSGEDSTSLN